MATLDWDCTRVDGVTLVELFVTSEREQTIRIESTLTPVWPPRRQGQPEHRWEGATFEGTVGSDERLVVGYASPAEPAEPPAELTTAPVDESADPSPRAVIQALGDGTPPRDVVPSTRRDSFGTSVNHCERTERIDTDRVEANSGEPGRTERESQTGPGWAATETTATREEAGTGPMTTTPAEPVPAFEAYFEAIESRLESVERLAESGNPEQARAAVTEAGGIDHVSSLRRQLRADRTQLERIAKRQQALTCRLDAVEIPVGALEGVV